MQVSSQALLCYCNSADDTAEINNLLTCCQCIILQRADENVLTQLQPSLNLAHLIHYNPE
jgi:hypothetical protein